MILEDIIIVKDLSKSFSGRKVLNSISVSFKSGKIYGIVGRNGSGKSVFFKILCGLMCPDSGSVSINGKLIGKDEDFPQDVGAIIEAPGFLPRWSGFQNLRYLASLRNLVSDKEIRNTFLVTGLDPDDRKPVGKYSLGMKQRLGIAQAIMEDPQVLILDEPMNGLDYEGVCQMRDLFLQLRSKGKTIIIASHSQEDITFLCDEVYRMDAGVLKKAFV